MKSVPLDQRDYKVIRTRIFHHIGLGFLMAICFVPMYLLYPIQELPSTAHKLALGGLLVVFAGITFYSIFKALQAFVLTLLGKKEVREGVVESYSRTVSEGKTSAEYIQVDGKEYRYGKGTSVQLDYPTRRVSESELSPWIIQKGDRVKIHLLRDDIVLRIEKF